MAIYGKIKSVVITEGYVKRNDTTYEYTIANDTGPSVGETIDFHYLAASADSYLYNYDDTDTSPSYNSVRVGSHASLGGAGGDTENSGAPWGILLARNLQPGEVLTISGYPFRGRNPSDVGDSNPASMTARWRVFYENRPFNHSNFTNRFRDSWDGGVDNEGVPKSTGDNVGVISPWEWSPGEDYSGFFPATRYDATSDIYWSENSDLSLANIPEVHNLSPKRFPKFFRIKIANDSQTPAAIKLAAIDPVTNESNKWLGWYNLKFKVEKTPRILEGATITSVGDFNFRNMPTGFWAGEAGTIDFFALRNGEANYDTMGPDETRHVFEVRSINCIHSFPGRVLLNIGGGDSNQNHIRGFHNHTDRLTDFNSFAVDGQVSGVHGGGTWSHYINGTHMPKIKEKSDGSNKIYVLHGTGVDSLEGLPPGVSLAGNPEARWVQYEVANADLDDAIRIQYRVYESPDEDCEYGLNNAPENNQNEHLYFQYKIGTLSWVTARTHEASSGHPSSIPRQNLGEIFTTELYKKDHNWGSSSTIKFRWVSIHNNNSHQDLWGIDNVQRSTIATFLYRPQGYKIFVAPADGEIYTVHIYAENQAVSGLSCTLKLLKLKDGYTIGDEQSLTHSVETLSEYTLPINTSNSPHSQDVLFSDATLGTAGVRQFSRGDVLLLQLSIPDPHGHQTLGQIQGLLTMRYLAASFREVT